MLRAVEADGSECEGIGPPGNKREEKKRRKQKGKVAGTRDTSPQPRWLDDYALLQWRCHLSTSFGAKFLSWQCPFWDRWHWSKSKIVQFGPRFVAESLP